MVLSMVWAACGGGQSGSPPPQGPAGDTDQATSPAMADVSGPAEPAEQPAESTEPAPPPAAEPTQPAAESAPAVEPARPANPAAAKELLEQVAAGQKVWRRSCPGAKGPEPCARSRSLPAANRCGAGPFETWVAKKRRAAPAKRAAAHMTKAQELWQQLSEADRTAEVRAAYGAALFVLLEGTFGEVLDSSPPRGLSFDPDKPETTKRDQQRFMKWIQSSQAHLTELRDRARAIVDHAPNTEWAAAASARSGVALAFFANQLERIEIPINLRKGPYAGEAQKVFCDLVVEQAGPLHEQSRMSLEMCAGIAQRVPAASAWLEQCKPAP